MNPIRAAGRAFKSHSGFTYVMDSTLWECDSCGDRVPYMGRRRHAKQCPERSFDAMVAETEGIGDLPLADGDQTPALHREPGQRADTADTGGSDGDR